MPSYDEDLLDAATRLIGRRTGQAGKLAGARIGRSISTTYYALFHFLLDEAGRTIVGGRHELRRRRNILARIFTHAGLKSALGKCRGSIVDPSVSGFLAASTQPSEAVRTPAFVQQMAAVFLDVHAKRQDADYDLNKSFSEADARLLKLRVEEAIAGWRDANGPEDRDIKHALCLLMLLKGQLRRDD